MSQYKCEYFKIYELVDPLTYKQYGQSAWQFLDPRLLITIDKLRAVFGPATINNWKWGGKFKWSGLRTPECRIGAKMSQHRFGRAADMKFKNISAKEIRKAIKSDPMWTKYIHCVENKVNWLHIDVRNCDPIKWINP